MGVVVGNKLRDESGYSMVEVMVAILILAIAIIPMVGMFDAGLRAAVVGSNYDQARALANRELEQARSLPYDTVKNNFPTGTGAPGASGVIVSPTQTAPSGYPSSFSYTVRKAYARLDNSGNVQEAANATSLMIVKVTVNWDGGKTYTTEGLVVK